MDANNYKDRENGSCALFKEHIAKFEGKEGSDPQKDYEEAREKMKKQIWAKNPNNENKTPADKLFDKSTFWKSKDVRDAGLFCDKFPEARLE